MSYYAKLFGAVEYTGCIFAEEYLPHNECPKYDTKKINGVVKVLWELWRMWSIPSLPSLPDQLWPEW